MWKGVFLHFSQWFCEVSIILLEPFVLNEASADCYQWTSLLISTSNNFCVYLVYQNISFARDDGHLFPTDEFPMPGSLDHIDTSIFKNLITWNLRKVPTLVQWEILPWYTFWRMPASPPSCFPVSLILHFSLIPG